MRLVFAGTPAFSVPCLEALLKAPDIDVVGVVSQPDRPAGRGMRLTPSPVKQAAIDAGIDVIACMSVNDVFVMDAWGKSANAEKIDMLADGNAEFSTALGLEADASAFGMGMRSRRFALVADDGIVTHLMVDAPGEFRVSSAESVLEALA